MAFRVSPGVSVTEKDFTNVIPAVSTTRGAAVINSDFGPEEQRVLVANEPELVSLFGKPNVNNYRNWLNVANYLSYGGSCLVARATTTDSMNSGFGGSGKHIKNEDLYNQGFSAGGAVYGTGVASGSVFYAKFPGDLGNSLRTAVVGGVASQSGGGAGPNGIRANSATVAGRHMGLSGSAVSTEIFARTGGTGGQTAAIVGDTLKIGNLTTKFTVTGVTHGSPGTTISFTPALTNATVTLGTTAEWEFKYANFVERPYTTSSLEFVGGTGDQFTILVIDEDGKFNGTKDEVLEVFNGVSLAKDAKDGDGNSNFYVDIINKNSKYIKAGNQLVGVTGGSGANESVDNGAGGGTTFGNVIRRYDSGVSGAYGATSSDTQLLTAYNLYSDPDTVDVSLILSGAASASLAGSIVDIADARKDCVAFISPEEDDCVDVANLSTGVSNVKDFRNTQFNKSSSYAFMDSGWKYQYDRHNDTLRWVPLNGDMAGLCARTDNVNDPWFSPAGFNRGQVRGVVKLAINPTPEAQRDDLYIDQINPVVSFPGEGTILFGDKTLQSKGSAFDRINVRRLFIVMEKAISTAAKFQLFEQNDAFTRSQFKNLIEPFLRDIQGRRGITDFKVVCDDTNNTSEVIDGNRFVADIFVKPTRSINFIQLNFVAARSGVDFNEIAGT